MGETSSVISPKPVTGGNLSEEIEQDLNTLPNMEISHLYFSLKRDSTQVEKKQQFLQYIQENQMAPYYKLICEKLNWNLNNELYESMMNQNQQELEKIEIQLKDAMENLGDVEILDALFAKARVYSRIGDKKTAIEAFLKAKEKPQSINQKIMVALHIIRLGLFFSDLPLVEEYIQKATILIDEGGDWDRRNRLKVYEGCYKMMARDFKTASKLFQESIATFTCTELMDYKTMIFYCIICCVLSMSRVDLKQKIVNAPEVLAVLNDIPHIGDFLNGLYECNYKRFFTAIVELYPYILDDKYLATHARYIYREFRILAYTQFLQAYKSVTMESMALAFGISIDFLDHELARFISAGRLNAKIDKVAGVIETNRPDAKNAQYQDTIKQGDILLNRVQKLARVINI